MTERESSDFYEDDEPIEKIVAVFDRAACPCQKDNDTQ